MKYENPVCEIVELEMDIVTASGNIPGGGSDDTPIMPAV